MYGYDQTGSTGYGYAPPGQQGYPGQPGPQHGQQYMGQPDPYAQQHDIYAQQQAPLYPEPAPASLQEAVQSFANGVLLAEDFQAVFSTSKVYCPRGDNPGFLALQNSQQPVIPMFSTLKELRRYAGKESRYFVITGAEVLDLLPSGYGFVLDMESAHRVVFDAKAVEEMVDFAMRRMYG